MKIHLSSNSSLSFWNKLILIDKISQYVVIHLIFNLDLLDLAQYNRIVVIFTSKRSLTPFPVKNKISLLTCELENCNFLGEFFFRSSYFSTMRKNNKKTTQCVCNVHTSLKQMAHQFHNFEPESPLLFNSSCHPSMFNLTYAHATFSIHTVMFAKYSNPDKNRFQKKLQEGANGC